MCRCDLLDYGDYEDRHDTTVNQMLVPRSHQEDATIVLNNLLKEYDKTLRPDIGGKAGGGPENGPPENGRRGRGLVTLVITSGEVVGGGGGGGESNRTGQILVDRGPERGGRKANKSLPHHGAIEILLMMPYSSKAC